MLPARSETLGSTMSRLDSLIRRVDRLEAELAHASETAFQATASAITVRVILNGLLATLPDETLDLFVTSATAEATRQRESGLAAILRYGADTKAAADYLKLHDSVLSDLKSQVEREKARRGKG